MTPHEALAEHLKTRPELPRPVPPVDSPAWRNFAQRFHHWACVKEVLEARATTFNYDNRTDTKPKCAPRADFSHWRDL